MKKLLVMVLAGIMAMFTFVGCGTEEEKSYVEVNVAVVDKNDEYIKKNDTEDKWMKYTFWSDDTSDAYRQCKESYYWHLDQGETVSEIVETSSSSGDTIYYFKVKVAG